MSHSILVHRSLAVAVVLVALSGGGAPAAELFVKPAGSGTACIQASPCSLATALATAAAGDTIYVGMGTYTGSGTTVVALDRTVSLLGGWDGAASGAVRRDPFAFGSSLDGQNARRVVTITGGSPTVDGFTITRGDATGLVDSCRGSGNQADGCGGAIFAINAAPVISNNTITGNVAAAQALNGGSGTGYGGGIMADYADHIAILSNTIVGNTASTAASGAGGGVSLYYCQGARIAGNRILDNVASSSASAPGWGGGVAVSDLTIGTVVENNLFRGNAASNVASAAEGNALFVWYGAATVRDNAFFSDHTGDGAVYLGEYSGVFARNRVVAGADAAAVEVMYGYGPPPLLANNFLVGGAGTAAVVMASGSIDDPLVAQLAHNTIVGNAATSGVYAQARSAVTMVDTLVTGNGRGLVADETASIAADHTLFWANDDDGIRGTNPVDGDPLFVNAPRGDYHIQPGSAAQNAGVDAGVGDDIDHEARPGADGFDIGADELAPRSFDFGTPASPVAAGYVGVSPLTTYSAARGYGWLSGSIASRDRGAPDDLTRDFDFTKDGTFVVDLPNGRYGVTITFGDRTAGHDQMGVFLEGQQVTAVSLHANQFTTATYEISVLDGQLTVELKDLGGNDPNVVIDAMRIAPALPLRLDLGTGGSPVAAGYRQVTPATGYSTDRGAGWIAGTVQARDRGGADPLLRDFNFTHLGLFGLLLANGVYDLTVTYGDATTPHDGMATAVQGTGAGSLGTAANQFVARTYAAWVADNLARLFFVGAGGKDPNVAIDAIEVAEPAPLRFDFGTATSPVALGYLQITPATSYSQYRGWGWLSGAIAGRDRGTGDSLTRDFDFTPDGTFAVDVLPGRYQVTITLGDATTAHDSMGVFLEGQQVDTVSTLVNHFTTRTYTVSVTDGQLTLELKDMGGSDHNVAVDALEVR
jgi:fibronectin type 3 domain-containing protein